MLLFIKNTFEHSLVQTNEYSDLCHYKRICGHLGKYAYLLPN